MCLERYPGIFLLWIGLPGSAVSLEFPRFRDKAVGNADDLPFCDNPSRCGHESDTLIQPRVEDFKGLVIIVVFPELPIVLSQVRCLYPCIVRV